MNYRLYQLSQVVFRNPLIISDSVLFIITNVPKKQGTVESGRTYTSDYIQKTEDLFEKKSRSILF